MHTDLNVMACLEYSVKQLKVRGGAQRRKRPLLSGRCGI